MSINPTTDLFNTVLEPHRWKVEEFEAMLEAGVVTSDSKLELLAGVITKKVGTGSLHDFILRRLLRLFYNRLSEAHEVGAQSPIRMPSNSRPEPDLWISVANSGDHRDETIAEDSVALVVEIADSSLNRDKDVKLPIYAEAGIPEYWIIDVKMMQLYVYTKPVLKVNRYGYDNEVVYVASDNFQHEVLSDVAVDNVFA